MSPVRVGTFLPPGLTGHEERRRALARIAEAGLDHVGTPDHVSVHTGWGVDGLIEAATPVVTNPPRPWGRMGPKRRRHQGA